MGLQGEFRLSSVGNWGWSQAMYVPLLIELFIVGSTHAESSALILHLWIHIKLGRGERSRGEHPEGHQAPAQAHRHPRV